MDYENIYIYIYIYEIREGSEQRKKSQEDVKP
jgi:hypothetical protein